MPIVKTGYSPGWFRKARKTLGFSQAGLARALGVDKNTIYRKERPDALCGITETDVERLAELAAELGRRLPKLY